MNNIRIFSSAIVPTMAMLVALLFPSACDRAQKPAEKPELTTIACSSYRSLLAEVALMQGFFKEEGLAINSRLHPYGKLALDDLIAGDVDFATVAETPVLFAILEGADVVILATIYKATHDHAIVGRKDRGIFYPSDLKDKRIAVTFSTTSDFFLDIFLAANSISRGDIELVSLPQEEMPQALLDGRVDAVSAFDPYLSAARQLLGDDGTVLTDETLYTNTFNVVSTRSFVRDNPEKVQKMLRALYRAESFFKKYPEKVLRLVSEFNGEDLEVTRQLVAASTFELSLDQLILLILEDEARWAIDNGRSQAQTIPNFLNHIYFDGLKSVKPDKVRILE